MSAVLDPGEFKTIFVIFSKRAENVSSDNCEYRRKMIRYYYLVLVLISIVYTCLIANLTRRFENTRHRQTVPDSVGHKCFRHHFGLPVPVIHLAYRYHTLACAAAYLCAFVLIGGVFTDTFSIKFDFPNAPLWAGIVFKILVICFMAITIIPIFLSLNYGGTFAWMFGLTYCLVNSVFCLATIITGFCGSVTDGTHYLSIQLPSLIGYSILCGHFITNIDKQIRSRKTGFLQPCPPDPTYYVNSLTSYVKERLQISQGFNNSSQPKPMCHQRIRDFFYQTFHPPNGFFYPTALIWSLIVSVLLHYFMLNRVLITVYTYLSSGKQYITDHYPELEKNIVHNLEASNARYVFQAFSLHNVTKEQLYKIEYALIYYLADLFWIGTIFSSTIACLVNLLNVVKILYKYQILSFELFQKGFRNFPQFSALLDPAKVTTGTMLFPSYQIAMMGCGFHLQVLLYIFLFMILSIVIGLNAFTPYTFIVDFFRSWWPSFILMFIFSILQTCLIKFVYTANRAQTYGFDNIRSLQQFLFFASFYNVFFGIINGAMRILFCPISSAVSVARMDMSLFPQTLQSTDKAYVSFLGFIYGDVMQHNPILRTFLWLLCSNRLKHDQLIHSCDSIFLSECLCFIENSEPNSDYEPKPSNSKSKCKKLGELDRILLQIQKQVELRRNTLHERRDSSDERIKTRANKHWFLAYTLIRNPQLTRYRKPVYQNSFIEDLDTNG